jgi:hypothetical protein
LQGLYGFLSSSGKFFDIRISFKERGLGTQGRTIAESIGELDQSPSLELFRALSFLVITHELIKIDYTSEARGVFKL